MSEYEYLGGISLNRIQNKRIVTIRTDCGLDIMTALDQSGIPFSARYLNDKMRLIYDENYVSAVDEIIEKANSGRYAGIYRVKHDAEKSLLFLPEIAECLHTTVGSLKLRPRDIQLLLCKAYADFCLCDSTTLRRELQRYIYVKGRTEREVQNAGTGTGNQAE